MRDPVPGPVPVFGLLVDVAEAVTLPVAGDQRGRLFALRDFQALTWPGPVSSGVYGASCVP